MQGQNSARQLLRTQGISIFFVRRRLFPHPHATLLAQDFVLGEWVHNPIQTEWSIPWVLKMGNCEIDDSETLAKADVETGATLMLM